jgi:muramoyltetrapeptide carboxypeptidase LdcA involved in peptidoglycan recycling
MGLDGSEYRKPARLVEGAVVAVLSTSWGGPHEYPHVFEAGVRTLTERFGLQIREYPTTRTSPSVLAANPRARAHDLNAAFADSSVQVIIASIGGNDSARILEHLDPEIIRANPKIFMGYSDTTAQLVYCHQLGMVCFNGPCVMAGFAQIGNFPEAEAHIRSMLFEPSSSFHYQPYPAWVDSYPDWTNGNASEIGSLQRHDGWHWLNAAGKRRGRLFGGCIEVLEFLKGTRFWPHEDFWNDRILFLETSEDKPSVDQVRAWLFNYGVQGVFNHLSALLIGRARGYTDEEKAALDVAVLNTVVDQFGGHEVNIVTNMDFGHTDPQWILPLGIAAEVDSSKKNFSLVESAIV